jgi:AcrR family transcriptional regulator
MEQRDISSPPGKKKILKALRHLLEERNFQSITIAEIARTAGVTEGLIYKYFKNKREILHQVLSDHYRGFMIQIRRDLKGIDGTLNRLQKIIWTCIDRYANHRVFARIILLEVRNSDDYFESEAYQQVRTLNTIIMDLIDQGVKTGEIRREIPPAYIRNTIFGAIEHSCMNRAIFNKPVSTDETARHITDLIFNGIKQ